MTQTQGTASGIAPADYGFILGEDLALRRLLSGVTVSDQKSISDNQQRQVGVFYGQPDQELRAQSYPYMTIDLVDIERDPMREMRGTTNADYLKPIHFGVDGATNMITDLPIPVNLIYQITTYARNPRHDRQILSTLLSTKLIRFGVLEVFEKDVVDSVANTETVTSTMRRLDLLSVAKSDNNSEQAKRLYRNVFTVRVSSEMLQSALRALYSVLEVHLDVPTDGRQENFDGIGEIVITQNS